MRRFVSLSGACYVGVGFATSFRGPRGRRQGGFANGWVGDVVWVCRGGRGGPTGELWGWKGENNENETRLSSVSLP